jgi:hypothetical protein
MPIDYRSFNNPNDVRPTDSGKKWWALKNPQEIAQAIVGTVTSLANADAKRQTQYQISARLYGNTNIMGINGLSFSKIQSTQATLKDRVSYNVIQSCVDTLVSKISKNRPKPSFITSGATWKVQRKAKQLDKFVDGIFYENEMYKLGAKCFRDALVWGTGVLHVFEHEGRCKFERVIASEIYVDQMESFYGHPRQMHRVKNVDRSVLAELYPDHKDLIMGANAATIDITGTFQNIADQISVVESWHLPSGKDAKDGMHVISIAEGILFKELWEKCYFPFAFLHWSDRLYGFWGQGLAEQIQNIQLEINKLLWVIQRSMHMAGTFKVFLEHGSKIVKEHISNDIGVLINYTGTPPTYVSPPIVPPEIYAHLQTLKGQAFEQAGISQLSATSQKPAGLNSGKALREYNDIETERFMSVGHEYEQFYIHVSKLAIDVVKDIYAREKSYRVNTPGKKFLDTLDWKQIHLEDDEYTLKIYPVSKLPTDPAGQLQTITEYIQAGFISPRAGRRLLDFPDLERAEDLGNAQEEWLHKVIEDMIDNGTVYHPEPDDDLTLARELALQYLPFAKTQGAPEENIQILRDFISEIDELSNMALTAGQQMMPEPQAPAMPMAPSELVPNVPMVA